MIEHDLEQRLRNWYRDEIGFSEPAPEALRDGLEGISATYRPGMVQSRRTLVLLAAAVMLMIVLVGALAILNQPRPAPLPGPLVENGVIAFSGQDEQGNFATYVVNPDGSGLRQITTAPVQGRLSWSPDGMRLAYVGTDPPPFLGRNPGIHVMNADGSGDHLLSTIPGEYTDPAWSPDGRKIAFSFFDFSAAGADWDIYVIDPGGSNLQQLTSGSGLDLGAVWSPDGSQIAFMRETTTGLETDLFVMNADGSGVRQLTDDPGIESSPAWSPDGLEIAYSQRPRPAGGGLPSSYNPPWDIWAVSVDGSAVRQLTNDPESELNPEWSPDGTQIVFGANGHEASIYVMDADGSNVRPLLSSSELLLGAPSPTWAVKVPGPGG